MKVSTHMYVKNIQRKAIKAERENAKKDPHHLVLQIDFAENWAVIHNKAVQGNLWVNEQISIFTAVSYQGDSTQSFAAISDDRKQDSAYALLAVQKIIKLLKENCCDSIKKITIVSDGAVSHFKNRFQLDELK